MTRAHRLNALSKNEWRITFDAADRFSNQVLWRVTHHSIVSSDFGTPDATPSLTLPDNYYLLVNDQHRGDFTATVVQH